MRGLRCLGEEGGGIRGGLMEITRNKVQKVQLFSLAGVDQKMAVWVWYRLLTVDPFSP